MYQTTEDCAKSGASEERSQLFMEIRDGYLCKAGSRDGNSVACESASIFTVEVWAINKTLEQIKDSVASKYIIFTDSHSCLKALQYMKLEHHLIGMVIRKCVFLNFANRHYFLLGTQAYWH